VSDTAISTATERQRSGLKPFPKGVSGNPAGRPKQYRGFIDEMRDRAPKAIEKIDAALNSDNYERQQWAVQQILDRAFGKPRQQLDVTVTDVAQVVAILAARRQRVSE
jgi:Asp-tRNA(Asn)/Glu-tRNA(Gln) amidotransferase A subunit family amidase